MHFALVPSLYMAYLMNPVSWVLAPSHFTQDNMEALRDRVTCPNSWSESVEKVRGHPSS